MNDCDIHIGIKNTFLLFHKSCVALKYLRVLFLSVIMKHRTISSDTGRATKK